MHFKLLLQQYTAKDALHKITKQINWYGWKKGINCSRFSASKVTLNEETPISAPFYRTFGWDLAKYQLKPYKENLSDWWRQRSLTIYQALKYIPWKIVDLSFRTWSSSDSISLNITSLGRFPSIYIISNHETRFNLKLHMTTISKIV